MQRRVLTAAILAALHHTAFAATDTENTTDAADLGTVVVTAPEMLDPFTVVTDPKAPVQPVPAADGAAYLKNIPGFSMVRKGGTSGDPVLRGMAGSRLNILNDDTHILGGCGMRMDPPTAYTYPESYDRITVLKGPQSVRYGVSSAGTVLFDREPVDPTLRGYASLLVGIFGRHDEVLDASGGSDNATLRGNFTRSESGDYDDGDGNAVHSRYQRWSASATGRVALGATTHLEITGDRSDAQAAYADRGMDGIKFDRTGYGAKLTSEQISPLLEKVEVSAFHNYVDHLMDNYSLRTLANPAMAAYSNPDRETNGARIAAQLNLGEKSFAWVGIDQQSDQHTLRMLKSSALALLGPSGPRLPDASFEHLGIFGELEHDMGNRNRVVAGLRVDWEKARAEKTTGMPPTYGGAVAGTEDKDTNTSGFARWEHGLNESPATLFVGYGVATRSPDYWERSYVFDLKQERTGQLDLGMSYRADALRWTASIFHARHDDYILITPAATPKARNIKAVTYGGEADLTYRLAEHWQTTATIAYVRGENETDHKPLAQMAPLEGTLGVQYADPVWSAGATVRVVDKQDRVDVGSGTIVGQDIGPTDGFQVFSVNAGYKPRKGVQLTAGIDNLFDKTYAEHISRAGFAIAGFEQTTRVNEPGRFYWVKASVDF